MKFFALCLTFTLFNLFSYAQSVGPTTINSSGGGATISGNTYDYAIGEMTLVNTAQVGSNDYTQGVLQPFRLKTDAITEPDLAQQLFSVFPNPNAGYVNIVNKSSALKIKAIRLFDATGKILFETESNSNQSLIDMSAYPNANYTLAIICKDKQFNYSISKFK